MLKLALAVGLAIGSVATPALAQDKAAGGTQLSQAECKTMWEKAVGNMGQLSREQGQVYAKDWSKVDTNSDQKISQDEWMQSCKQGEIERWAKTDTDPAKKQ